MTNLMTQQKTMSSLEIAELTGKRHADVMRDIRNMLEEIQSEQKCADYKDAKGRTYPMLLLDKNESLCLVAGYNVKMRMAIIKRWQDLENNQGFKIPQTFSEALQLATDQAKQLEEQAPKVRYFDKVSKNETHMNATQVAQKFKMSAREMNKHLVELGIYNKAIKRGKVFSQAFIDSGYGEMKQTELGYSQAVFTTKGEQYIAELLTSEGII